MLYEIVHYLAIAMIIPTPGMGGIAPSRKNTTIMPMSIEPMPPAVNPNPPILPVYTDDLLGQLFALSVLTVAAAEPAIGPATPVAHSRMRGTISVQFIHFTKGQVGSVPFSLLPNAFRARHCI